MIKCNITIRKANLKDSRFFWRIRNEKTARMNSLHTEIIPWKEHKEWFNRVISSKAHCLFVIRKNDLSVGIIRFQREVIPTLSHVAVMSVTVLKKYRRQGIAYQGCKNIFDEYSFPLTEIWAYIEEKNLSSERLFEKLGFKKNGNFRSETSSYPEKCPKNERTFNQWKLSLENIDEENKGYRSLAFHQ